eukprot:3270175-Rhodomonas_salina.1
MLSSLRCSRTATLLASGKQRELPSSGERPVSNCCIRLLLQRGEQWPARKGWQTRDRTLSGVRANCSVGHGRQPTPACRSREICFTDRKTLAREGGRGVAEGEKRGQGTGEVLSAQSRTFGTSTSDE